MSEKINAVANQRVITVSKSLCDKAHKYTANNLEALDEAAFRLQSKAGFKLYMYLAKNQDKYEFALSSKAFIAWAGVGRDAYNSAFKELVEEGYLIAKSKKSNRYIFYDKSQIEPDNNTTVIIEIPEEKVKERQDIDKGFIF